MKKLLVTLLSLMMILSMASPVSAADVTVIEYWTFAESHVELFKVMAEKWNAEFPDRPIELSVSVMPYDDMHNKLLIALQSGVGAPDMVDIEIGKFANFLKGEPQLAPLNRVVEPVLDDIVRARVDIYAKDGNFYGICFHVGAAVIYYNDTLLKEAGIDYTTIKTWDDYAEAGAKFLEATGKPLGTVETTDLWHFEPMVFSQGGDILNPEDGTPNIDNPAVKKALAFNQDLLKKGILALAPGGNHHAEEYYGMMNAGSYGSVIMPMWYMNRFTDYMPDLSQQIAIAPMPVWEEGQPRSVGLGGTGTAVTNQADDPDLTMDFLAFAKLSREGNIEVWNVLGFDPIRTEVWGMTELRDGDTKFHKYYIDNPFDVLMEIKDEILAITVSEYLPAASDALKNTVFFRAYEEYADLDTMLPEENAKIK